MSNSHAYSDMNSEALLSGRVRKGTGILGGAYLEFSVRNAFQDGSMYQCPGLIWTGLSEIEVNVMTVCLRRYGNLGIHSTYRQAKVSDS